MREVLSIVLLLFAVQSSVAGERVIADDGREVMLDDDGRWEFVSQDRFATTASGERVRLRADGSWEIVAEAAAGQKVPASIATDTGPAGWSLRDVIIETARGQRSASRKSVSKETQTVFHLRAKLKSPEVDTHSWTLDTRVVRIVDSGGREYPILDIAPDNISLDSDASVEVVIRVDGSPHWFTTRYFEVRIAEQAVGNTEEVRLKRALANVQKRDVEEFQL